VLGPSIYPTAFARNRLSMSEMNGRSPEMNWRVHEPRSWFLGFARSDSEVRLSGVC
jgi:hypothetical protein